MILECLDSVYSGRMHEYPAGLGLRLKAFLLDYIVIAVYLVVLVGVSVAIRAVAPSFAGSLMRTQYSGEAVGFLTVTAPVSLYFLLFEASSSQATLGKRRIRLKVIRVKNGSRLSTARSLGRTALKFAPWELSHAMIWYIVFHPAGTVAFYSGISLVFVLVISNVLALTWSPERQTLYDLVTGTAVTQSPQRAMAKDTEG